MGRYQDALKSFDNAKEITMLNQYTAKYTKIPSGYMGQLIEWPEVITEGK
jgi:hypothetical protein